MLATTLVFLVVNGSAATLGKNGKQVGEREFVYGETVRNDNLWTISRKVMPNAGKASQNQVMAAMLRRNPDAFWKGNLFYLHQGVVLTIPSLKDVRAENAEQADALFEDHRQAWEEGRLPTIGQASYAAVPAEPSSPKQDTEKKSQPATSDAAASAKSVEPPVVSTAASKPTPVEPASEAPSATPLQAQTPSTIPAPVDTPKPSVIGTDRTDATAPQKGSDSDYLSYGVGLAAVAGVLFFLFRSRRRSSAADRAAADLVSASPKRPSVALSMAGMETSQALETMHVTQQVVAYGSAEPIPADVPDTDGMKLKIAKAYLELKRDNDAHALLEEVIAEGNGAHRNEAEKLLGRWSNALVAQDAAGAS